MKRRQPTLQLGISADMRSGREASLVRIKLVIAAWKVACSAESFLKTAIAARVSDEMNSRDGFVL